MKAKVPVKKSRYNNMTGFLTIVMIFVTVLLVMFATMTLMSTRLDRSVTDKTERFIKDYYEAYSLSEERLAEVSGCIAAALADGAFDLCFEEYLNELTHIDYSFNGREYFIRCSTPINETSAVYWEISVSALQPSGAGDYRMISRKVCDISGEGEEDTLNVWDGDF
ncbi:MAG: hypothetical protein ACI4KF_04420 [Huintestinicola sp.]